MEWERALGVHQHKCKGQYQRPRLVKCPMAKNFLVAHFALLLEGVGQIFELERSRVIRQLRTLAQNRVLIG